MIKKLILRLRNFFTVDFPDEYIECPKCEGSCKEEGFLQYCKVCRGVGIVDPRRFDIYRMINNR